MVLAAGGLATMIHRSSYKLNQAETFGFWIARRQFSKVLYFFRCSSEKNQPTARGDLPVYKFVRERVCDQSATMSNRATIMV